MGGQMSFANRYRDRTWRVENAGDRLVHKTTGATLAEVRCHSRTAWHVVKDGRTVTICRDRFQARTLAEQALNRRPDDLQSRSPD
jgi:hypothetical protein